MKIFSKSFLLLVFLSIRFETLIAQEQIIQGQTSISELRGSQLLQLEVMYDSTDSEKTAGLGLRLHFDSSAIDLGELASRLTEGALPYQIKADTSNLDNNSDTDKYLLTPWADTSGQGWPYNSELPVLLYRVPITAAENFSGTTLQFSGYTAVGYSLNSTNISIPLAIKPVIALLGDPEVSLELGTPYNDAGATASDNIDGDITSSIIITSDVDVNTVGTYSVNYNVNDAAGNAADQVTRIVNITPDVTKPVITILGDTEVSLELGTDYNEAGATASDNIDVDITSSIIITSDVDVNTVGTYSVNYNVNDAAGNAADQVTRIVNITPDVTKPVITILGDTEVSLELGTPYTDLGATASDNIDGEITSLIETVNNVDIYTVGTYSVTYNVSDTAGNTADEVTRMVNITPDVTKPVITITGGDIDHEQGTPYTDLGATALDNIDGDITSSISVESNVDPDTAETYTVVYSVSDSSGNAADQKTRTVVVSDTTEPVITLIGENINHEQGMPYTDLGATALDNIDGDITSLISVENNVDSDTAGTYTVVYSVSDNSGNAADQKTRLVVVSDTTKPVITIMGGDIAHEQGTPYTDLGATALDNIDGDITLSITVESDVDSDIAGTYTVIYSVSDSSGNAADQKTRTVAVSDTTKPVINLIGDSEIDLLIDDIYVDSGATALDNIDGDITNQIITFNPVNTSDFGTYIVTYNVQDSSGNEATEVTRSVYVGGTLDVDGNGRYDALTDGLLILRYMFGLDGETLILGTVASDAILKTPAEIEAQIELTYPLLDVDGNSKADPLTDGLLIIRYLFEIRGDTLILGVIASDAIRRTSEEIEAHLARMVPIL